MKNPFNLLFSLVLGLSLLASCTLQAQEPSTTTTSSPTGLAPTIPSVEGWDGDEDEEIEWMIDGLFLTAETIGIHEDELFSALAHGLSMADVAIAHGVAPIEILDIALSFEESFILDELIEKEISLEEAEEWREEAAFDSAWLLNEEDPFGLEDIAWVLDGAAYACDLSMLELCAWMCDGVSIEDIAKELEVDLEDVTEFSLESLDETIEVLLLLEEIDEDEAEEWFDWSEEMLEELLADEALFENLADEIWADEMVALLAEIMELGEDDLWDLIEDGEDLQGLLDSHQVKIEDAELQAEVNEFLQWWNEDDFEDDAGNEDF